MADKIGEGYVEISARDDKFVAAMAESRARLAAFDRERAALGAKMARGMTAAPAGTEGLANTIGLMKQLVGLYAVRKVGGFIMDAAGSGGDMIETMQKVKVTFGDATGSVMNMADDMAAKFGSNKGAMLDAASTFGLIGQGAAMSEAESAKMAIGLTKLADDASSFYNIPLDVALQKIRSGLTGEIEPLRSLGVLLSAAAVKARLLEMGIQPVNGQFTEAQKVMARVQLITEGLNKAQGDHARTMDSYANQIRQLAGDWENFKTAQGVPLAAATAGVMSAARNDKGLAGIAEKGSVKSRILSAIEEAFFPDEKKMAARLGADAGGVVKAGGESGAQKANREGWEKFLRERQAYDQFMSDKYMRENAFKGGGFGAMGMFGQFGQMLNSKAMLEGIGDIRGLDRKIAKAERQEWGGGHVTDTLGFLRQAQEQVLKPQDETQKEQLAELKAIRQAILQTTPDGKRGTILKGRES